jgi:flagellar motor switch protein FliM
MPTAAKKKSVAVEAPEVAPARVFRADGVLFSPSQNVAVGNHDFRTPRFLAETELRRLRKMHQNFAGALSAHFSSFLRADVSLKMTSLSAMTYGKFAAALPDPRHLVLFKAEPLPGVAILDITPQLALSMTNRMLGGTGNSGERTRALTDIEIALLEELVQIITAEWCRIWPAEFGLAARHLGHETSARFLQVCPKDTILLIVAMEVVAGDIVESLQIAVPHFLLEPVLKTMQGVRTEDEGQKAAPRPPEWRNSYSQIAVSVTADWPIPNVAISDILRLRVGDVVELSRGVIEKTRIRLSNSPRFLARAGNENGHSAVQIRTVLESEESL